MPQQGYSRRTGQDRPTQPGRLPQSYTLRGASIARAGMSYNTRLAGYDHFSSSIPVHWEGVQMREVSEETTGPLPVCVWNIRSAVFGELPNPEN